MKVIREDRVLIARSSLSQETCTALEGFSGAEVIGCGGVERWSWSRSRRGCSWDLGEMGSSWDLSEMGCRRGDTCGVGRGSSEEWSSACVALGEVHFGAHNKVSTGGTPFGQVLAV